MTYRKNVKNVMRDIDACIDRYFIFHNRPIHTGCPKRAMTSDKWNGEASQRSDPNR